MVADSKKIALENLITKIKTHQEFIAEQTNISSIDIDLQLEYIRALYEHYISLKQALTSQVETEIKPEISECGTLPLFNSSAAELAESRKQKAEIEDEIGDENEEDFSLEDDDLFENMEENKDELDESEENEENFEDLEEDIEDEEDLEDEEEENDLFENEEIEEEEDFEENEEEIEEQEENITENIEIDAFNVFPAMEIEMNLPTNSDIDIDAIEFEEEEEDTDTEDNTEKIPIPHIGTSGQPRYWGDELDVEPVPAKPTSIGDQYMSNKPSLNEIVSGFKPDDSIGMKLQHASVSDLMKSIDMNLKFLFVKNLFKGNGSAFTEEINKINSIRKLPDAMKYLEEIKEKYNWDEKSEAYTELYKLVLRKYAR